MPHPIYNGLRLVYRTLHRAAYKGLAAAGLNVYPTRDFYSPLPVLAELERTRELWNRPSEMVGVDYDLEAMKARLAGLVERFAGEYELELPPYDEVKQMGYGPGFTLLDAMTVYLVVRDVRPRRYLEIGSGISTYYAWRAARRNGQDGAPCEMGVIDPFPRQALRRLEGVEVEARPAQEVPLERYTALAAGDVLFIDTTHVVKVGGEVAFLFLEVLPRLAPGVRVHVHDIHFPFHVPVPAERFIFKAKWPSYWTEAMLLQAFLAFNREFAIELSTPMIRHFDEAFLDRTVPGYRPVDVDDFDTFAGSIWLRRRGGGPS